MKKLLFSFLMVSVCFLGNSQLERVTVEEVPLTGLVGTFDFTGYTNYRLFAEVTDAADQVTAVLGNSVSPLDVTTTTTFFRQPFALTSPTVGAINPAFFGFAPDIRYHSALGIGNAAAGFLGVPESEDSNGSLSPAWGATDGLGAADSGTTSTLAAPGEEFWTGFQASGQSFVINTFSGGTWYTLPGGANTLGTGANNSVFLGSFTTAGDFSYNINVGVQDDLLGSVDYFSNVGPGLAIDGLSYPLVGCDDVAACNYDSFVDVSDLASCVYAAGCDVCDGAGGVTDNPEAGDVCDDLDPATDNDVIQADCSCAGEVVAADPCSTAIDVSAEGTFNSGAIVGDYDGTIGTCFNSGPDAMNWFFYTATADGELTVSSVGSGSDTQVAAASGTCAGGLTEVACNDDINAAYESEITFAVTNGETYYIVWGNGWEAADFSFTVTFAIPAVAPANDLCANAEALATDGTTATGDNTDATATSDGSLGGSTGAPEVWYSFVGTGNTVNVETFAGTMTDSQLLIYDACGGTNVGYNDDGGTGAMSLIANFCTVSGTTYFVEVQGWNGQEGSFDVSVTDNGADLYCSDALASNYVEFPVACQVEDNATCLFVTPGCQDAAAINYDILADADCSAVVGGADTSCCVYPPANDTCANAEALTIDGALVTGDNTNASDENDADEANNWGSDGTEGDVWFSFVGNGGLVDIETFDTPPGGNNDTQIAVYAACGSDPSLASDDDNASTGGTYMSEITGFCAEAATTYLVEVEGWNGTVGAFNIEVRTSVVAPLTICDDITATNYVLGAACDIVDNATCSYAGCTSATALNYDVNATTDDGSCIETGCVGAALNWAYCYDSNEAGGPVFSGTTVSDIVTLVVNAGTMENTYDFITFYDGSDNTGAVLAGPLTGDIAGLLVQSSGQNMYVEIVSDTSWSCQSGQNGGPALDVDYYCSSIVIVGCTDASATNYDPTATVDDGTCIAPTVPNDTQAGAELLTMTAFGTCTSVSGTNDGATDSPESALFSDLDVWYSIVPTEPGIRVQVASFDMDLILSLYDAGGFLLVEDATLMGDDEILFADAVPGQEYFLSIAGWNGGVGSFEICAQELPDSRVYGPNQGQVYPCGGYRGLSSTTSVSVAGGGTDWTFDDGVNPPITYSTAASSVNLDVIPGLLSGTTYDVTINPYYENFGVSSIITDQITISGPVTGLKTQYINSTVTLSQNAYVRCLQSTACGYESFDWRITDVNTGVVSNVSTAGDLLFLSSITDVTYNAEYTAEIAVVYDGGQVGAYGAPQTFFTGAVPTMQVMAIFNSSNTLLSVSQYIRATPKVFLATSYEWSVVRTDITDIPFLYNSGVAVRVARVSDMPLAEGGTYNLEVRAIVPGAATVFGPTEEVVVLGGSGMVQNDEDTSPEIVEETVVKDNVISAAVTMYPNPAKDFVTLNITGIAEGTDKVLVAIFNTVGQLVQSEQIPADGNYVNSVVALNGLAEGMYNVQITVGNTVSTERMIIQK